MARNMKAEPIITYAGILGLAAQNIRGEVLKIRQQAEEMEQLAQTPEDRKMVDGYIQASKVQEAYHIQRLEAIETMYRIETGSDLGVISEIQDADDD